MINDGTSANTRLAAMGVFVLNGNLFVHYDIVLAIKCGAAYPRLRQARERYFIRTKQTIQHAAADVGMMFKLQPTPDLQPFAPKRAPSIAKRAWPHFWLCKRIDTNVQRSIALLPTWD